MARFMIGRNGTDQLNVFLLVLCLMDFGVSLFMIDAVNMVIFALVWISVALTIISGAVYLKGYWKYIDMK